MVFALIISFVSCDKKPLSEKEAILKAVRNDRDLHFESTYNRVTRKSFEIDFPGRQAPSFDEFINSAVVEISNDIAVVTCSLAMESGNHMHTHQKDTSYIIAGMSTVVTFSIFYKIIRSRRCGGCRTALQDGNDLVFYGGRRASVAVRGGETAYLSAIRG